MSPMRWSGLTGFLFCIACNLFAAPSSSQTLYGPGGLFIHPTAYTPKSGALSLSASSFTQQVPGQPRTEWEPFGISYGVTDRLEVGGMYVDRLGVNGRRRGSTGIFVREQLASESTGHPAFAITGSYLGSDVLLASVAGVGSYRFRLGGRRSVITHVGVQWAWRGDGVPSSDAVSVFSGAELPLSGGFFVLGEYGTRFSFDYSERSSIGLMWRSRHNFSVAVGFVNVGRSRDNRLFIGVGVPIGGNN